MQNEQIVYSVLAFGKGGWEERRKLADMHTARKTADELFSTGKCKRVKVDKIFFDSENNRFVTTTIFNRDRTPQKTFSPMIWLLLLAIFGGVVSFAVTYVVASQVF